MNESGFSVRQTDSATDFMLGVKVALEARLKAKIYPIESLRCTELIKKLDQSGIDAFCYDQSGHPRALASRVLYQKTAATRPMFTFRYALWNARENAWDCDREYIRKLYVARNPHGFILFPHLHVESYCTAKRSGLIEWSFAAHTRDILEYAEENLDNRAVVRIFEPKTGERRKVISVSVEAFAKHYRVLEIAGMPS